MEGLTLFFVKDIDEKLVAVFTDKEDLDRFFEPGCHEYWEVTL